MPRTKGGPKTRRRHKKTMKAAKGYVGGRRKTYRQARETVERGLTYAYRDRKQRKRDFRGLWIARINAAARQHGLSYSRLIAGLKAAGVDRRPQDPRRPGARRSAGVRRAGRPRQGAAPRDGVGAGSSLQAELARLREAAAAEIAAAESVEALEAIRVRYLGRKGSLNAVLRGLGQLPPEERPAMGALANAVKDDLSGGPRCEGLRAVAEAGAGARARGGAHRRHAAGPPPAARPPPSAAPDRGRDRRHLRRRWASPSRRAPRSRTTTTTSGRLNFPPDHPARDTQDTFFVAGDDLLLRTHTSPVQLRVMRSTAAADPRGDRPGTCYRRDDPDPTHSPMFHQIEGFLVDERVTFGDLKGVLTTSCTACSAPGRRCASARASSRSPSPAPRSTSAASSVAAGAPRPACRVCKGSGWLEILGSGMIHPNVLRAGRLRSRARAGLRLRHRHRSLRPAPLRPRRSAALLRRRPAFPRASSEPPGHRRARSAQLACRVRPVGGLHPGPRRSPLDGRPEGRGDGGGGRPRPAHPCRHASTPSTRIRRRRGCSVCRLDLGAASPGTVVSAARRARALDSRVAVALAGATLPDGRHIAARRRSAA